MAEENEGQGQEPTPGEGQGQEEGGQQGRTFTQDDVNRMIQERLERATARFADYEDLQKAAKELQKLRDAELSETERLGKEIEALKQAAADAERQAEARAMEVNEKLIRAEVRVQAAAMGFVNPGDAYRLADLVDVKVDDEDGTVQGVEKALKALAKAKPYLLSSDNGGGVGTPPRGGKRTTSKGEPPPVRVNF